MINILQGVMKQIRSVRNHVSKAAVPIYRGCAARGIASAGHTRRYIQLLDRQLGHLTRPLRHRVAYGRYDRRQRLCLVLWAVRSLPGREGHLLNPRQNDRFDICHTSLRDLATRRPLETTDERRQEVGVRAPAVRHEVCIQLAGLVHRQVRESLGDLRYRHAIFPRRGRDGRTGDCQAQEREENVFHGDQTLCTKKLDHAGCAGRRGRWNQSGAGVSPAPHLNGGFPSDTSKCALFDSGIHTLGDSNTSGCW